MKKLLLLVLLLTSTAVWGYNGLNLLKGCEVELMSQKPEGIEGTLNNIALSTTCAQYVRGYVDALLSVDKRSHGLCFPSEVHYDQVILYYINWAKTNANELHLPQGQALLLSMKQGFSCARKR